MKYILVTGDRNWKAGMIIKDALLETKFDPKETEVVHGGCKGADLIAADQARKLGFGVKEFTAQWGKYSLSAGPIRNKEMFEYIIKQKSEYIVLVFHDDLKNSRGTASMVKICSKRKDVVIKYYRSS